MEHRNCLYSPLWGRRKRVAFTLAEVLITLAIIGVVAALTIPTLIADYQKKVIVNQLKKVTAEFSLAVRQYMYDEDVENLTLSNLNGNSEELKRFTQRYFKIVNDCKGSYVPCFADTYLSIDKSEQTEIGSGFSCEVTVSTASGYALCLDTRSVDNNSLTVDVLSIEVDVNGKKGPNVFGRDFFGMRLRANGTLHDARYEANGNSINWETKGSSTGAFGQILMDGWQIKY